LVDEFDDMRLHSTSNPQPRRLNQLGLAAAVAHEVRRLLTPAKAYAELAVGAPLSTEASQAIAAILRATQGCEAILDSLVTSGGDVIEVPASVADVAVQLDCENLVLDIAAPISVAMSPTRLLMVLSNLVANGSRATASNEPVEITTCSTGNTVQIRVTDRGIGMNSGQIQRATNPFVSFSSGSGIGLAICQHLVEEAGGSMWIASAEGRGTCVTVELPAAPSALKKSA